MNKTQTIVEFPLVGLLYYTSKITASDYPQITSKEEFDMLQGYEPMQYKGTYEKFLEKEKTFITWFNNFAESENSGMVRTIPIDKSDHINSKKRIMGVESSEGFIKWCSETSSCVAEYFKNYV